MPKFNGNLKTSPQISYWLQPCDNTMISIWSKKCRAANKCCAVQFKNRILFLFSLFSFAHSLCFNALMSLSNRLYYSFICGLVCRIILECVKSSGFIMCYNHDCILPQLLWQADLHVVRYFFGTVSEQQFWFSQEEQARRRLLNC